MKSYKKIAKCYRVAALTTFNILVLFVFINLILSFMFYIKDQLCASNPVSNKYGKEVLSLYPHMNEQQINILLKETWCRPYIYEPFTQFTERPYDGRYVKVDKNGFRFTINQGPWPLDPNAFNIFLFGGSTTFGYGVPDSRTIASHLQEYLTGKLQDCAIHVYNFGRGYYYSTQERILFEQLLVSDHIPTLVIFIDGLNDFSYNNDEPFYTHCFQQIMDDSDSKKAKESLSWFISKLPIGRAIRKINLISENYLNNDQIVSKDISRTNEDMHDKTATITRVINRYLANKRLIESAAAFYNVQSVFVWQPVPTFKYDDSSDPFAEYSHGERGYSEHGYKYMEKYIKVNELGSNFLWCANIQQGLNEPLYVDKVHYSAKLSKQLAVYIGKLLLERDIFERDLRACLKTDKLAAKA